MKATETDLLDLIAKEAAIERARLVREATLEDLGVSSLEVITLLGELEERYGVAIEAGDLPEMTTLGELVDVLLARIDGEAAT